MTEEVIKRPPVDSAAKYLSEKLENDKEREPTMLAIRVAFLTNTIEILEQNGGPIYLAN